ncbi:MAG: MmcQ/YjbR family DNA-binding protein [Candidatus Dormibacteraeota bacterium]|uniref:MmcQ/YjbR family DNA-binding protein n=1 Tax=Candidatus Amunia macphersoniae TaxID=3127014 RepID=A0A934NF05_9BACT|nr:MmcQ/YjbR family DNA-binding protein [Candidatus Dormibacteraeota bacterium]
MPASCVAHTVAHHALSLPQAWEDHPWEGDLVAKVGKKIFAFLATGDHDSLGVKLPASAGFALSLACADPMGYGLGKHGWVTVNLVDSSLPGVEVLCDWVTESYRAVASKTLVRQLDSGEAASVVPTAGVPSAAQ